MSLGDRRGTMPKVKSALIVANMLKSDASELVTAIREYLEAQGIESQLLGFKGKPEVLEVEGEIDLALSLGGDGTVLFAARLLASRQVPILAVNIGDFGFITEVSKHEWKTAFERYTSGQLGVSERLMLEVSVRRNGSVIGPYCALNDALISAHNVSKVVRLDVSISDTELGRYRADGVLIASPTGSTAYSMAAGGPILSPEMDAMVLVPVSPFTLSNRPLVVPGHDTICIEVEEQKADVNLTLDGQVVCPLGVGDVVEVKQAKYRALIVRSDKRNFFDVLRAKLKWAGGPDA